jgi:hypothetical protein
MATGAAKESGIGAETFSNAAAAASLNAKFAQTECRLLERTCHSRPKRTPNSINL